VRLHSHPAASILRPRSVPALRTEGGSLTYADQHDANAMSAAARTMSARASPRLEIHAHGKPEEQALREKIGGMAHESFAPSIA
jgi:hypothetical protein